MTLRTILIRYPSFMQNVTVQYNFGLFIYLMLNIYIEGLHALRTFTLAIDYYPLVVCTEVLRREAHPTRLAIWRP